MNKKLFSLLLILLVIPFAVNAKESIGESVELPLEVTITKYFAGFT